MTKQDRDLIIKEARKAECLGLDLIRDPIDFDTQRGLSYGNEDMEEIAQIEKDENPILGKEIIEKTTAVIEDPEAHFKDYDEWLVYRRDLEAALSGSEDRYWRFFKD